MSLLARAVPFPVNSRRILRSISRVSGRALFPGLSAPLFLLIPMSSSRNDFGLVLCRIVNCDYIQYPASAS